VVAETVSRKRKTDCCSAGRAGAALGRNLLRTYLKRLFGNAAPGEVQPKRRVRILCGQSECNLAVHARRSRRKWPPARRLAARPFCHASAAHHQVLPVTSHTPRSVAPCIECQHAALCHRARMQPLNPLQITVEGRQRGEGRAGGRAAPRPRLAPTTSSRTGERGCVSPLFAGRG
jgi:hypothetical protein